MSVREQAALVVDRLRRTGTMTFRALAADAPDRVTTVARFLALLELFREQAVSFEQLTPLGELTIRWTGSDVRRAGHLRRVRRGRRAVRRGGRSGHHRGRHLGQKGPA